MRALVSSIFIFSGLGEGSEAAAQVPQVGDLIHGKLFFQQNCALCHADNLGPGNTVNVQRGPSLMGIFGRPAGSGSNFSYTKALGESGLTWNPASLDRFLKSPTTTVPGTAMPIPVPNAGDRLAVIAYLSTLKVPAGVSPARGSASSPKTDPGDWHHAAPSVKHHITVAALHEPIFLNLPVKDAPSSSLDTLH